MKKTTHFIAGRKRDVCPPRPNQCRTVKITILGDEGVPIQVDGEAWIQPPGVIKIQHKNRAQMLTRDRVSFKQRRGVAPVDGTRFASRRPSIPLPSPCRRLRTRWSHGRTSWSTTSRLCGRTSTRSSPWIWRRRRKLPWCSCAPELQRSSLQGKRALPWISSLPLAGHTGSTNMHSLCFHYKWRSGLIAGYARLPRPTGCWSRSWLTLLMRRLTPSTKHTPSSRRYVIKSVRKWHR